MRWVFPHAADHDSYIFNYRIERDNAGNLLFLFPDDRNHYTGVLMDAAGHLYDYSPVLKQTIDVSPFPDLLHNNVWSSDFRRNLYAFQQGGLIVADLQFYGSISTFLEDNPTRGIAEWEPDTYLVRSESRDNLITANPFKNSTAESLGAPVGLGHPLHPIAHSSILAKNGYWWYSSGNDLVRVDSNKVHTTMHIGSFFTKFAFLEKQVLALVTEKNQLCFFDLATQKLSSAMENGRPVVIRGDVNELLLGKGNILWIATLQGLWKSDLKTGVTTQIGHREGLRDERIMCMYENGKGKLWLGTYTGGLQVYDPGTGSIQVIDRENGLSNNTVVGILRDDDGMLWVSTFNGVNLVSAQGEVLAHLDEKDGLSTNEFNRYSFFKDSKGRLLFGSVKGVNILDPAAIKRQLGLSGELRIYLTSITRYDNQKGADSTQYYGFEQLGMLHLPAAQRYLNLSFALSSFVRLEDQTFAYKIEQPDHPNSAEWIFLENNSQLYLPNLPPGTYNIFIRGSDHRGNRTPTPLVIKIHVAEFFYKTWWFYVLCALPLLLGAYFWIRHLQTERERLETEVTARTQQIQRDKALIEKQAQDLQELDQLKSSFFTNISHEFRTPLTVISGMSDIILKNPGKQPDQEIKIIRRNSLVLLDLVKQILDLKKLETGKLQLQLTQGDILTYLRYIAESFTSLAGSKNVRLDFRTALEKLLMDYDPEKIRQIVSNLLSNALKFTPEGGAVTLTAETETESQEIFLVLQVRDTGSGIAQKDLPHVFNLFYQARHGNAYPAPGTGVGLALVQELTRLMRGNVSVSSQLEKGSVFTVRLPVTRNAPLDPAGALPERLTEPTLDTGADPLEILPASREGLPSLLIVEDNRDIVRYLVGCLEQQFNIAIAYDGQEGMEKAFEQPPDIILSDVMMPRKDGLEMCRMLKQDERTSHVPIVLLTAKADADSRITGLRRGADAYLAKPFNREELLVSLQQLIEIRRRLQDRYRNLEMPAPSDDPILQQEDAFMQKLRMLIEQNIEDARFGAPELGQVLGMSRSGLYAKLKALTDRTPALFIRSIRLQRSKELLLQKEMNISEVAYAVGFDDPAYFSRCFSEEFGLSPSQYRDSGPSGVI
ncbi:MAG: response regulator [Lewinellaceae bacterium]|nr:response regulator [Lewinellaceae bacterium]